MKRTLNSRLATMPLYWPTRSPMGPVTQYVDEKPDAPITLNIYTGADGKFSLYEDDGVSNAYMRNEFTRIPVSYTHLTLPTSDLV